MFIKLHYISIATLLENHNADKHYMIALLKAIFFPLSHQGVLFAVYPIARSKDPLPDNI